MQNNWVKIPIVCGVDDFDLQDQIQLKIKFNFESPNFMGFGTIW